MPTMPFPPLDLAAASRSPPSAATPPTASHRIHSRAQSQSSDKPSTIGFGYMSPPLDISPEAAFIAVSAASQIVTNDHDNHADAWYDQHGVEPSGQTALVSNGALQLVNNFLDQLLLNFLATARSTTLSGLRPAVSEVLKPKLAKDAVRQADEELSEYLGGTADEDVGLPASPDQNDWDLELVWKRTRLRCMVYSSLGDMEEEDEDYHMEQGNLDSPADEHPSAVVSPAVAIFLTSILEFMGEQALIVAGQAAYHRMRAKHEKEVKEGTKRSPEIADRIVVEDMDMERVALDRTLGRLWRAWKKRVRGPGPMFDYHSLSRRVSRDSIGSHPGSSILLAGSGDEPAVPPLRETAGDEEAAVHKDAPQDTLGEEIQPSAVPLPMGINDVDEIEVPGLVSYSDDEDDHDEAPTPSFIAQRPRSMVVFQGFEKLPPPVSAVKPQEKPLSFSRKRSSSTPAPLPEPYHKWVTKRAKLVHESNEESGLPAPANASKEDASAISDNEDVVAEQERDLAPKMRGAARVSAVHAASSEVDEESDYGESDGEGVAEEAQILTSSRVSMGEYPAMSSAEHSKATSTLARSPSIRPPSVHSLRVIDVAGPKSPRSRNSSTDASDRGSISRSGNLSRTNSVSATPIAEDEKELVPGALAARMVGSHARSVNESISEAEENPVSSRGLAPSLPITEQAAHAPQANTSRPRQYQKSPSPDRELSEPIFGSADRPASSPRSATKVTMLGSSTTPGSFFIDDGPDVPQVPVRSAGRGQHVAQGSSSGVQPSGVGIVSIDRVPASAGSPERVNKRSIESSPPALRQVHTSSSSTSSGTNRRRPTRTSDEGSLRKAETVARNFEELIQSDQTIQYTLTPENMRDIDSQSSRSGPGGSPVVPVRAARRSEDAKPTPDRTRSSSLNKQPEMRRAASVSRSTGLMSHPVDEIISSKPSGPVPRSTPPMQSRPRPSGPQARDARPPRESMADLADFIRSTGPFGASFVPPRTGPGGARNGNAPPLSRAIIEHGRSASASNVQRTGGRLQARDPTTDARDDNSDLIDFIRRGPPSNPGDHRIPRTVAPFRSTMDSDQMSGAVGGKAVDARLPDIRHSQASTSFTAASMHSSINSQSALINKNKPLPEANDDGMVPKRKQRRVRDPYAIDLSDEEEEDDEFPTAGPGHSNRRAPPQEESLIDFLRSVPPPADPTPAPQPSLPKKKASAQSLMARFVRRESSSNLKSSKQSTPPPQPAAVSNGGGRGYIPIQVNMPSTTADNYGPGSGGPQRAAGVGASAGRVPMKRFEPREAVASSRGMSSDLAEFFRSSGPPGAPRQEDASAGKGYPRRKKSTLA